LRYLYGDGTESPLTYNFLEYLRLALDFSVAVLNSHTHVGKQYASAKKRKNLAKHELAQLNKLRRLVDATLEKSESQISTPTATECIGRLKTLSADEIDRTEARLRSRLSEKLEKIQETVDWEYAENERRLEKLLLNYDIPKTDHWIDIRAADESGYAVALTTMSDTGVDAVLQLAIPENHPLGRPVRVDSLEAELTVKLPYSGGWGRKDAKLRTYKLTKEFVVAATNDAEAVEISLRNAFVDGHSGYDLRFSQEQVTVTRIAKQEAEEPFPADGEDAPGLVALMRKIQDLTAGLSGHRTALKSVDFEGTPLHQHTEPTRLVRRLLDQMGPVAREVAAHSLSPGELILKRVLSDDRREEIFASVEELRKTYSDLPPEQQALFAPLGFDAYVAGASKDKMSAPPPFAARPPGAETLPRPSAGPPAAPKSASPPGGVPVPKPKS
jgi:hypothetical protein